MYIFIIGWCEKGLAYHKYRFSVWGIYAIYVYFSLLVGVKRVWHIINIDLLFGGYM